tara:strand:+ start:908 stop:1897 length:990 start_codon:yes stop_codon:yes gene_type:complete
MASTNLQLAARNPRQSDGVVLLSMLLVIIFLTALVYQIMMRHSLTIAQTEQTLNFDRLLSFALGAESLARQALHQDHVTPGRKVDSLQDIWARPLEPLFIEDGVLEIQIRDLNRCFNLNSLSGPNPDKNAVRLGNLFSILGVPSTLVDSWRDWVDNDQELFGRGAEDGHYLLQSTSYRPPNTLAGHVSELHLVKHMRPEYFELIEPYVCVIPSQELAININTVSGEILKSLEPKENQALIEQIVSEERYYETVGDLTRELPGLASSADVLSVKSSYFEVHSRVGIEDNQIELVSILYRDPQSGKIKLISRDLGKSFNSYYQKKVRGTDD